MKSEKGVKKRVVFGILLIGIIIISIGFVSAWWIFGDDSDEEGLATQSATAKVNVQAPANPPVVWWVSQLNGTGGTADPIAVASSGYFTFNFYACSEGGLSQLPDANAIGKVSGTRNGGTATTIDAISCSSKGVINLVPPGAVCGTATQSKNYSCTIQMWYFYDRYTVTGTNVNWAINASLKDPQNVVVSNLSQTFLMGVVKGWAMTPNYVNWSSLQSGAAPVDADNEIKITNQGNVDISSTPVANLAAPLNISATHLMRGGGVENISAGNFSASVYTSDACAIPPANQFIKEQFVNIDPFNVPHTTSTQSTPQSNNLSFCIQTITVSTGTYETGATQKWTIRALE